MLGSPKKRAHSPVLYLAPGRRFVRVLNSLPSVGEMARAKRGSERGNLRSFTRGSSVPSPSPFVASLLTASPATGEAFGAIHQPVHMYRNAMLQHGYFL
jgi:hypothetical protein